MFVLPIFLDHAHDVYPYVALPGRDIGCLGRQADVCPGSQVLPDGGRTQQSVALDRRVVWGISMAMFVAAAGVLQVFKP